MLNTEYGLDIVRHSRKITTTSTEAQIWFDRGLSHTYGFNHEEAICCFKKSLECDPNCFISAWGIAQANGVNYNSGNCLINAEEAFQYTKLAYENREKVSDIEKALIEAIFVKYEYPMPDNETKRIEKQNSLNNAFADAMKKVYNEYSNDPDVISIYAESLMNLNPWKLWEKNEKGEVSERTHEIEKVLEQGLQSHPNHPGILHFYIHCEELSPHPEKALNAANRLRTLIPDGGHLLHMASHIDIWLGHYENAIKANQNGVIADEKFVSVTGKTGTIYFVYRLHNYHFLIWASMFDGQYQTARNAAEEMNKQLTKEAVMSSPNFFEGFSSIFFHVLIRFGKWEEILQLNPPEDQDFWVSKTVFYHYARGIAFSALGQVENALEEEKLFFEFKKKPQMAGRQIFGNFMIGRNGVPGILDVAEKMLKGEIEYRKGNFSAAFELLREGVKFDDTFLYDEPWAWMQPVRHALGALLLEQNHIDESMTVFEKDLQKYPENMWSLHGLCGCLKKQNKTKEHAEMLIRFQNASKRSEVTVNAACFCANRPLIFDSKK
eukprot:c11910_g1_i1.p1 GENE.c11910_g1_i1~~c11910_g1_i1.p1  ORF type:complete len:550 (+),score=209.77 c11910_g1_i1:20-1669(+)